MAYVAPPVAPPFPRCGLTPTASPVYPDTPSGPRHTRRRAKVAGKWTPFVWNAIHEEKLRTCDVHGQVADSSAPFDDSEAVHASLRLLFFLRRSPLSVGAPMQ